MREWCINTAAVNPATNSIFVPNENGRVHRWNLATNSLSEAASIGPGLGQPYVPTIIGPDGQIYTMNGGTLFALGGLNGVRVTLASSMPDTRAVVAGESLTFTATITNTAAPGPTPTGTVTFQAFTYQNLTPITTPLASNVPLDANGQAAVTTSNLAAGNGFLGNHFITATYSGDANFVGGSTTLVQKVHARGTTTTVSSSAESLRDRGDDHRYRDGRISAGWLWDSHRHGDFPGGLERSWRKFRSTAAARLHSKLPL